MTERDRKIAIEVRKRVSGITSIVDFRVFGSRARGDADEYSDLDIFVEVEAANKALKDAIADVAWEVGFENDVLISAIVFSRDELQNTSMKSSPFIKNITEYGVSP